MHRALRAIVGGAVGTAIMLVILLIGEVETRYLLHVPEAIARFVGTPDQIYIGFLIFILVGVFLWPLLFLVLIHFWSIPPEGDAAVRGMLFAVVLWVAFVILGSGEQRGPIFVLYLAFTLIAHLVYGFTLGALFARLSADDPDTGAGTTTQ